MDTQISIENGIPAPPKKRSFHVLNLLEPGQSVVFKDVTVTAVANAAGRTKARHPGRKFTARTVEVDGVAGVRIWRTE
jgi:hypothetical protein